MCEYVCALGGCRYVGAGNRDLDLRSKSLALKGLPLPELLRYGEVGREVRGSAAAGAAQSCISKEPCKRDQKSPVKEIKTAL